MAYTLALYDTFDRKAKPLSKDKVSMYVCGLTPYADTHVGHLRTYLVFDMLKRLLYSLGIEVFHIQNITDVDDKLIKRSKELNKPVLEIASYYQREADKLFSLFNILPADIYPKVSEHIPEIVELVQILIDKGYAYEVKSGVYFSTSKFKDYGKLSGQVGGVKESVERVQHEDDKHDKSDFALWKKDTEGISFDSPFGRGRPGWHIECSAMALKYAGALDIHGGATDLIFPHHENEIAQSEAATGRRFVGTWVHCGLLTVNGEKMSKSLGNFITVRDALKRHHPMALRLFYLRSHYRSSFDYNDRGIDEAYEAYKRISRFFSLLKKPKHGAYNAELHAAVEALWEKFLSSMCNDLDSPSALAAFFDLMGKALPFLEQGIHPLTHFALQKAFAEMLFILGISVEEGGVEKLVDSLLKQREQYKASRDFKVSDAIRKALSEAGIEVQDTQEGPKWHYIS
ncbi:MAG: cysteine--tRNA ligase [Candidatus Anstonellales archaeon]